MAPIPVGASKAGELNRGQRNLDLMIHNIAWFIVDTCLGCKGLKTLKLRVQEGFQQPQEIRQTCTG